MGNPTHQNYLSVITFGKRLDTGREGIIIEDNPDEHCLLLRDLIPANELFQIIYDCETKCLHHRQKF